MHLDTKHQYTTFNHYSKQTVRGRSHHPNVTTIHPPRHKHTHTHTQAAAATVSCQTDGRTQASSTVLYIDRDTPLPCCGTARPKNRTCHVSCKQQPLVKQEPESSSFISTTSVPRNKARAYSKTNFDHKN
jgi:hypothetical protein